MINPKSGSVAVPFRKKGGRAPHLVEPSIELAAQVLLIPADALEVSGNQVFVGAGLLNAQQDRYEWTIRSYDAIDGSLRWENHIADQGVQNAPEALKAWGGRLYAAGSTQRSDGSPDFTVRTYSTPE